MSKKKKDFPRRDEKGRIQENCYTFTMYPDSESYDYSRNYEWLKAQSLEYCFAKHDKDKFEDGSNKKLHTHVYVHFQNLRVLDVLANSLKMRKEEIDAVDIDLYKGVIKYFAHDTKECREQGKVPYDHRNFDTNMDLKKVFFSKSENTRNALSKIRDFIDSYEGYLSYSRLTEYCIKNNCISELIRSSWVGQGLLNEHNRKYFEVL